MITARFDELPFYKELHPGFPALFDWLQRTDFVNLAAGKSNTPFEGIFVIHSSGESEGNAVLEAHRKYIDIHILHEGSETIGYLPVASCSKPKKEFDVENDFIQYEDKAATQIVMKPGECCVFFPADAHAPLFTPGYFCKTVVKIPFLSGH